MAIDYGKKRVGIAVTDPLKIIANGLDTVATDKIFEFLEDYFRQEQVDCVVIGHPLGLDDEPTDATHLVENFLKNLRKKYPELKTETIDERFTSKRAKEIILQSGARRKKRRNKALVDKVSAVLILQDYMELNGL